MIRVIAAAVLMCTLLSCQKQYCWKCQTTTVVSPTGDVSHSNANVCDKTEKEIRQYEKDHTTQKTGNSGGQTVMLNIITSCNK
jgi:hypothetical protein